MKTKHLSALIALSLPTVLLADSVNVTGNITSQGGNIIAQGSGHYVYASQGSVQALSFIATSGYLQAGTYLTVGSTIFAGGSITANTTLSANGAASFGSNLQVADYLRLDGNTNTPASKSVQIGPNATTDSYNSLVVGQFNVNKAKDGVTAPTPGSWNPNDPLFVVGNGVNASTPNNALTVYKDGTVTMSKAQGDISMGVYGN